MGYTVIDELQELRSEIEAYKTKLSELVERTEDLYARPPMEHSNPNWDGYNLYWDIDIPSRPTEYRPRWATAGGGGGGKPGRPGDGPQIEIITDYTPVIITGDFYTFGYLNNGTLTSRGYQNFTWTPASGTTQVVTDYDPIYLTITTGQLDDYELLTYVAPILTTGATTLTTEDLGYYTTTTPGGPSFWINTDYNYGTFEVFGIASTDVGFYYSEIT